MYSIVAQQSTYASTGLLNRSSTNLTKCRRKGKKVIRNVRTHLEKDEK